MVDDNESFLKIKETISSQIENFAEHNIIYFIMVITVEGQNEEKELERLLSKIRGENIFFSEGNIANISKIVNVKSYKKFSKILHVDKTKQKSNSVKKFEDIIKNKWLLKNSCFLIGNETHDKNDKNDKNKIFMKLGQKVFPN